MSFALHTYLSQAGGGIDGKDRSCKKEREEILAGLFVYTSGCIIYRNIFYNINILYVSFELF